MPGKKKRHSKKKIRKRRGREEIKNWKHCLHLASKACIVRKTIETGVISGWRDKYVGGKNKFCYLCAFCLKVFRKKNSVFIRTNVYFRVSSIAFCNFLIYITHLCHEYIYIYIYVYIYICIYILIPRLTKIIRSGITFVSRNLR